MRWFWSLAAGMAALSACGSEARVDAPEPARDFSGDDSLPPLPPIPPGTIVAPLALDLESAARALEQEVPRTFGDIDKRTPIPGSKRKSFAFEVTRTPFQVSISGDTILLASVIRYKGRGWYDPPIGPDINGECGTKGPPPRARLVLRVIPRLSPDWHLKVSTRVMKVAPLTDTERDQCEVSFLNLDVTGKVMAAAEAALIKVLPSVERRLGRLDVRTPLEKIWVDLQQPIKITDSLWLLMDPREVHLGNVTGGKATVGAEIGVRASPRILSGPKPIVASIPLPELAPMKASEGFSMLIEGAFDYSIMSSVLTEKLKQTTVRAGGGALKIRKVTVFAIGRGRLALGLDFGGTAEGRIWFEGKPQYDAVTGMVSVPDLDFDATSAGMLAQGVAWLKGDAIREFLRAQATVSGGEVMARIQAMAIREMNRDLARGVHLTATIDRSEPAGMMVGAGGLILRARATGTARLDLSKDIFAANDSIR